MSGSSKAARSDFPSLWLKSRIPDGGKKTLKRTNTEFLLRCILAVQGERMFDRMQPRLKPESLPVDVYVLTRSIKLIPIVTQLFAGPRQQTSVLRSITRPELHECPAGRRQVRVLSQNRT